MNPAVLGVMIPIIALSIPVVAILMRGFEKVWKLRVEEARLRYSGGGEEGVQALRGEIENLRREVSELNERVDFTERLLSRGKSS